MSIHVFTHSRLKTARDAGVRAAWWREYSMPHIPFQILTQDGVELRGVHLRGGYSSLLVYCHGFLSGKNYVHIQRWVELLAQAMDVIAFDFRGHGESGGATTLGKNEVLDLQAVMRYARRFGYERAFVMGSSMGGAVAIRFAADSRDADGVITLGAFANQRFSLAAMTGLGVLKWSVSRRIMKRSYATTIESARPPYRPRDFVGSISPQPLLLIHGQLDPMIPVAHARELFACAREPKALYVIPRGGHDVENLNAKTKAYVLDWIDRVS